MHDRGWHDFINLGSNKEAGNAHQLELHWGVHCTGELLLVIHICGVGHCVLLVIKSRMIKAWAEKNAELKSSKATTEVKVMLMWAAEWYPEYLMDESSIIIITMVTTHEKQRNESWQVRALIEEKAEETKQWKCKVHEWSESQSTTSRPKKK